MNWKSHNKRLPHVSCLQTTAIPIHINLQPYFHIRSAVTACVKDTCSMRTGEVRRLERTVSGGMKK